MFPLVCGGSVASVHRGRCGEPPAGEGDAGECAAREPPRAGVVPREHPEAALHLRVLPLVQGPGAVPPGHATHAHAGQLRRC
jgi:hypothetical protein